MLSSHNILLGKDVELKKNFLEPSNYFHYDFVCKFLW